MVEFFCVCCIGWKRVSDVDNSSIEVLFKERQVTERFCKSFGCVRTEKIVCVVLLYGDIERLQLVQR